MIKKVTPQIGAEVSGINWLKPVPKDVYDAIYNALIKHLVLFFKNSKISPQAHMDFATSFGQIDKPHPFYPHVEGFSSIVKLENDAGSPPDTNSWHTDLTFKVQQPFASVLIARQVPECGGDTLWSSNYAAYDRLAEGMKKDLETLKAVHDMGDFRNIITSSIAQDAMKQRLDESVAQFGHMVRPLVVRHPVTGRKFLNFNEAFVSHILGLTTNDSNSLKTYLSNHMNCPEDQVRWRWSSGDMAMWDNRVTMHYAVADYLPEYRCMNRITVIEDKRVNSSHAE